MKDTAMHNLTLAEIARNLEGVVANCRGRVFLTTFASNVHRIQNVLHIAHRQGRRVVMEGRSMLKYAQVAQQVGDRKGGARRGHAARRRPAQPDREEIKAQKRGQEGWAGNPGEGQHRKAHVGRRVPAHRHAALPDVPPQEPAHGGGGPRAGARLTARAPRRRA